MDLIFESFPNTGTLTRQKHMGHQDQDGGKSGQMSLFDSKLEAATDRENKNSYTFKSYYLI